MTHFPSRLATCFALVVVLGCAANAIADDIIDSHIKAIGGSDAIDKITTIHRNATIHVASAYGPLTGVSEELYDLEIDRGKTSFQIKGFSEKSGWSKKSGWYQNTKTEKRDATKAELGNRKLLAPVTPLHSIVRKFGKDAVQISGERDFHGKLCYVVTTHGSPVTFFINESTMMLDGMSAGDGYTVRFQDYKRIDGVHVPMKSTTAIAKKKSETTSIDYEYTSVKLNERLTDEHFRRDDDVADDILKSVVKQIMNAMDKNDDAIINRDEASEDLILFFDEMDANSDQGIDAKEAEVMARHLITVRPELVSKKSLPDKAGKAKRKTAKTSAAKKGSPKAKAIIAYMDENKDGKIAKDEASNELKPYFDQIDIDQNGQIDAVEAEAMVKYAK